MIKTIDNISNSFLRKEPIEDITKKMKELNELDLIHSNIEKPSSFFSQLHDFCQKHKTAKRKERTNIEAVGLEVMIPSELTEKTQMIQFCNDFSKKALRSLPYAAYYLERGSEGRYIYFLVSERRYETTAITLEIKAASDVYMRINESNKKVICKASDPDAIRIKKKGTVYKSNKVHFTNKNRLFTGNDSEFQHKIASFKRIVVTILSKLHFHLVKKRVFFRKINIKEAKGNYYKYMNILALNDAFRYFEERINKAEDTLILGYMQDDLKELNQLKFRYLNRARNFRFQYGHNSLSFDWNMRKDRFQDNLEALVRTFDQDIDNFYLELEQYAIV